MKTNRTEDKSIKSTSDLSSQRFYHGTKANLKQGDLIEPGFNSNYGKRKKASYIYLTATPNIYIPFIKSIYKTNTLLRITANA